MSETTVSLASVMQVRRHQPTRLEGFVDASFAFAVTLVVISLGHVPGSVEEMLRALHGVPTFATCFFLLGRIWLTHRNWSRHYDLDDNTTVILSLALVFIVMIYVYPLRILFAQMYMGFSGGRLTDGTISPVTTVEELRTAYTVFGLGFAAMSIVFTLLYRHALRHAGAIGLSEAERIHTRMTMMDWIEQIVFCALSIALAASLQMADRWSLALPGLVYAFAWITGPLTRRHYRREIAQSSRR
jgi:uncharacterized membrane protein